MSADQMRYDCVLASWRAHEAEIRAYLLHRLADPQLANDLVQDVFLKALRAGPVFCGLDNPRAWLFQVARNALVDTHRLRKETVPLPDDLIAEYDEAAPVDALAGCLSNLMAALAPEDRDVLRRCDLEGMKQHDYAIAAGLTLAAVKSRLLRARKRIREQLVQHCEVKFDTSGNVCCHSRSKRSGAHSSLTAPD